MASENMEAQGYKLYGYIRLPYGSLIIQVWREANSCIDRKGACISIGLNGESIDICDLVTAEELGQVIQIMLQGKSFNDIKRWYELSFSEVNNGLF